MEAEARRAAGVSREFYENVIPRKKTATIDIAKRPRNSRCNTNILSKKCEEPKKRKNKFTPHMWPHMNSDIAFRYCNSCIYYALKIYGIIYYAFNFIMQLNLLCICYALRLYGIRYCALGHLTQTFRIFLI